MGVVLRIKDRNLDRTLAMKRMLAAPDEAGGEAEVARYARFLEEAQITAHLDHPSIVPIHELGTDEQGCTFYTMRLVKGRELGEVIRGIHQRSDGDSSTAGRLRWEPSPDGKINPQTPSSTSTAWNFSRVIGVLVRVTQTVAYAHARGVIHRDLKPANIMVGDLGEVYVMDWGLAKMMGREDVHDIRLRWADTNANALETIATPRQTQAENGQTLVTMDGAVIGTPVYMAPEQAAGALAKVNHLSDIYSLGAMLYEALTGQPPYTTPGRNTPPTEILAMVTSQSPMSVRQLNSSAPPELVAICEKAMARDPARRYQSCVDLAEDLQAFQDQRVVRAYRTGAAAEFEKWVRRNRLAAIAGVVALVAVLAGLTITSITQSRSAAREHTAFQKEQRAKNEAIVTLAESFHQQGVQYHAQDNVAMAFAHWAWALQKRPDYPRTAASIAAALMHNPIPQPVRNFRGAMLGFPVACFSPDGAQLAANLGTNAVGLFATSSGTPRFKFAMEKGVYALKFSSDGKILAVSSGTIFQQTAQLHWFDTATGKPKFPAIELPNISRRLGFSADGSRFTAAVQDGVPRVWSMQDGRLLFTTAALERPGRPKEFRSINAAVLSRDGKRLLVARAVGVATIYHVDTGAVICETEMDRGEFLSANWSPDETAFAVAGAGKRAQIFDARDGRAISPVLTHPRGILCVQFHPQGQLLLTAGPDGARLWDIASGREATPLMKHRAALRNAEFSRNGDRVVTASEDGTSAVWDTVTGLPIMPPAQVGGQVVHAELSPDSRLLLTAGTANGCLLWEMPHPGVKPQRIEENTADAAVLPGTDFIVTAQAGKLKIIHSISRQIRAEVLAHGQSSIMRFSVSADGKWIATVAIDPDVVRLWNVSRNLAPAGQFGPPAEYTEVSLSAHGNYLAARSGNGKIRVWSIQAGDPFKDLDMGLGDNFRMSIDDAGQWLTVTSFRGRPFFLNLPQGKVVAKDACLSLDVRSDGRAAAALGRQVEFWDLTGGQQLDIPVLRHGSTIEDVRFSPDGRRVLTCSDDNTARIWDAVTGAPLTEPMEHDHFARTGCWSPDGRRVATTTLSEMLGVWDVETGERLLGPIRCPPPRGRPGVPQLRGFLPDGRRLLIWNNGQVDLFDVGPAASETVPVWFGKFAETFAGLRVEAVENQSGTQSVVRPVSIEERLALREHFGHPKGDDGYARLVRWLFADPATSGPGPSLPIGGE